MQEVGLVNNQLTLPLEQFSFSPALELLKVNDQQITAIYKGAGIVYFGGQARNVNLIVEQKETRDIVSTIENFLLHSTNTDVIIFSAILDLEQAIKRLPTFSVLNLQNHKERFASLGIKITTNQLLDKINPINNDAEFRELRNIFQGNIERAMISESYLWKIINHSLHHRDGYDKKLFISDMLGKLSKAFFAIKDLLSINSLSDLSEKIKPSIQLINNIKNYKAISNQIETLLGSNDPDFKSIGESIDNLENKLYQNFAPKRNDNKRVIIVDTNCLVHHFNFIYKIKKGDVVVIPNTVLSELDNLKKNQDEDIAKKARITIDQLDKLTKVIDELSMISREGSHTALLSKFDQNIQGNEKEDREIISVALYHVLNQGLLVSDDKNCRNIARSEGVTAVSTQDYLSMEE
jgi:rRNA-processing protein FCF1